MAPDAGRCLSSVLTVELTRKTSELVKTLSTSKSDNLTMSTIQFVDNIVRSTGATDLGQRRIILTNRFETSLSNFWKDFLAELWSDRVKTKKTSSRRLSRPRRKT